MEPEAKPKDLLLDSICEGKNEVKGEQPNQNEDGGEQGHVTRVLKLKSVNYSNQEDFFFPVHVFDSPGTPLGMCAERRCCCRRSSRRPSDSSGAPAETFTAAA